MTLKDFCEKCYLFDPYGSKLVKGRDGKTLCIDCLLDQIIEDGKRINRGGEATADDSD